MVEVHVHVRHNLWSRTKIDLSERFLNFETVNGFVYLLWGAGFVFYGLPRHSNTETILEIMSRPQFGYNYGLLSIGFVLIFWALRKILVNRIKQHAKSEKMIARRKDMGCFLTSK